MKTITKLSFKKLLDKTKRTQYVDSSVVEEVVPCDPEEIIFFTLGKYISEDELDTEYANRSLEPASPYTIALYDLDHQSEMDEKRYVATHWKDDKGKWCFAAFGRWRDGRRVRVDRDGLEWGGSWWFAGVRKSSALDSFEPSVPLSLSPKLRKETSRQALTRIADSLELIATKLK